MSRLTEAQIEDRAHKALSVLSDTDQLAADLKFAADSAEQKYKATIDAVFLVEEGPIEVRKAKARQHAEPLYAEYLEAQRQYSAVVNKRKSNELVIDWLRSLYANVRQGR